MKSVRIVAKMVCVSEIAVNVRRILARLPPGVELVVAAKGRSPEEVQEAVAAGAIIIGENYLQDADRACLLVGRQVAWHFIGHLQRNKVQRAVRLFDMVQTVDSASLAAEIDRRCAEVGKVMPILVEVNSGREQQKSGVLPEDAAALIGEVCGMLNIRVKGLMTMGPLTADARDCRPYFAVTRRLFDEIAGLCLPNVEMKYLSMGMSGSYMMAVEEGATMVRVGREIFGER